MCFFRIGVGFLRGSTFATGCSVGIFLTEKFEDIVDIAEFRTDFLIGETLAAGVGEMGFRNRLKISSAAARIKGMQGPVSMHSYKFHTLYSSSRIFLSIVRSFHLKSVG